jgi:hypothetical protein
LYLEEQLGISAIDALQFCAKQSRAFGCFPVLLCSAQDANPLERRSRLVNMFLTVSGIGCQDEVQVLLILAQQIPFQISELTLQLSGNRLLD